MSCLCTCLLLTLVPLPQCAMPKNKKTKRFSLRGEVHELNGPRTLHVFFPFSSRAKMSGQCSADLLWMLTRSNVSALAPYHSHMQSEAPH